MKNTLLVLSITMLTIASCSKTPSGPATPSGYTCTCNIHQSVGGDTTLKYNYGVIQKDEATGKCQAQQNTNTLRYGTGTKCGINQ